MKSKTINHKFSNGKLEFCKILTSDSTSLKAGWGRVDYDSRRACNAEDLLEYCKENLSTVQLQSGKVARVEWTTSHTSTNNRGNGWSVATPTTTIVNGRWSYANA